MTDPTEMELLAAEQRADLAQITAEAELEQAEEAAVVDLDGEEFIGSCPDPLCCEYRDRFPNGPWTCSACHPSEPLGAEA